MKEQQDDDTLIKERHQPSPTKEWRNKIYASEEKRRRIAEMRHYLTYYMEA